MAKLKWMFLLAFLASGLVLGGCSSENDNIDNNDNNDNTDKKPDIDFSKLTWTKRTISSQIEAGSNTNISTRSSADIGHGGNPSSKLPDGIKYYINVYNSNTTDEEFKIDPADYLELTFENDAIIYYTIVKELLGEEWLDNQLFRLGTSRLANLLLSDIKGEEIKFF